MISASTLARKAAKSKNPAVAKRLRAQAARLRREARAKSKKVVRTRVFPSFKADLLSKAAEDIVLSRTAVGDEQPTWQVVPPLISPEAIEGLRTRAKSKLTSPDTDLFAIGLRSRLMDAKQAGRNEQHDADLAKLKEVHEINRINVVSAFMSELAGIAKLNGGALPATLVVAGFTLARVLDALRDAGHTTEGKEGIRRRS